MAVEAIPPAGATGAIPQSHEDAEQEPLSLLDRVLRNHPGLTREEASEMLIAFGASPNDDVRRIHAWRLKQLPAYRRTPAESDGDLQSGSPEHTP